MNSTSTGYQFWITVVLGIHLLLLPFCICITNKLQNEGVDWNIFTPKSISLPPLPQNDIRIPFLWKRTPDTFLRKITQAPFLRNTIKAPYTWNITQAPYTWNISQAPFRRNTTKAPYTWNITQEPNTSTIRPWWKTREPWVKTTFDQKNRYAGPPISFKDDYDNYRRTDTALKLIIFIPPFVILTLFLACKYCILNIKSDTSDSANIRHGLARHPSIIENNIEHSRAHNISNESTTDSGGSDPVSLTVEKPPDYASVVLSDMSEPHPRFPSVTLEDEPERPPSYHDAQNLYKY